MHICSCVLCILYNSEVMMFTGVSVKSHTHSSCSIVLPSLSNFCRLTLATTANDHSYIPIQFRFNFFFKIYALLHNTIVRSMMRSSLENPMTYGIGLRRSQHGSFSYLIQNFRTPLGMPQIYIYKMIDKILIQIDVLNNTSIMAKKTIKKFCSARPIFRRYFFI